MYISTRLLAKLDNCFNLCLDALEEVIFGILGFPAKRPSSIATAARVASEIDRALVPSAQALKHGNQLCTHPEVLVHVLLCECCGFPLSGESKVYDSICDGLSDLIQTVFAILSKVDALTTMSRAFWVLANGVENDEIKIGNCEQLA